MPQRLRTLCHAGTQLAHAGIVQDLAASFIRPELPSKDAVVMLMDARGTLLEIKVSCCPGL
jgi:hypothetical protein